MFNIVPYGEEALLLNFKAEISLEVHLQVKAYYLHLKKLHIHGVVDFIPAYHSLTICFCPEIVNYKALKNIIQKEKVIIPKKNTEKNIVEIPVCYDVEFGIDLEMVAAKTKLSHQQIIDTHTAQPYLVYMLGFAPGFMYLGGLHKKLHMPRKETPRLKVSAGSVGLADQQTGIYPLETPGGWQIIGRTPLQLFTKEQPSLVSMGDYVQFTPISKNTFYTLKSR